MFGYADWENIASIAMMDSNLEFYQNIKIPKFKEIADLQGFNTCPDLRILYPYLKDAQRILEIGSGYGRVVKEISAYDFRGKITALDRSPKMCAYIRRKKLKNVSVVEADVRDYQITNQPDVILWLWSGVLELSPEAQKTMIHKFGKALKPECLLVLEIPRQIKYVGVHVDERIIKVETDWGSLDAYLPSHQEMLHFQEIGHFQSVEVIYYQSDTGLERALYLYKK